MIKFHWSAPLQIKVDCMWPTMENLTSLVEDLHSWWSFLTLKLQQELEGMSVFQFPNDSKFLFFFIGSADTNVFWLLTNLHCQISLNESPIVQMAQPILKTNIMSLHYVPSLQDHYRWPHQSWTTHTDLINAAWPTMTSSKLGTPQSP